MTSLEQFGVEFRNEADIPKHIEDLLGKAEGMEIVELPIPADCHYKHVYGVRVLRVWDVIRGEWAYRADVCFKRKTVGASQ